MKNYIWDFDGMLFDSYPHIAAAFSAAMRDCGENIEASAAQPIFEISFKNAFALYGVTDEQKKIFREYEHDYGFEPRAVPFPNTIGVITEICRRGGRNFLYTHRGSSVYHYLEEYGLIRYFTDFVTAENRFPSKPAPDAVEYLVSRHGLDKAETIMIGDREIDVLSGVNAGVGSCLFSKKKKKTAADYTVTDIIQVLVI